MVSLNTGERYWSCPNLACQTVWAPHGCPYQLKRVDEGWTEGEVWGWEEKWEGEHGLECKRKFKKINSIKILKRKKEKQVLKW